MNDAKGMKPTLFGDGINDDTAAIQWLLDSGKSCVYLPPPEKEYLISRTLVIGDNTELRLDRFTTIRLAPNSDCPMLENRAYVAGNGKNRNVAVTGGIWDMDNVSQRENLIPVDIKKIPAEHTPSFFWGMAIRLNNIENLTLCGMTVRNPTTYGIELAHASYFLVDDITLDYSKWNPEPINLDGVHLDGCCHHGKISNIRGTAYDDLVALNANDAACSPEEGPIHDIDIDGLYADYCHSAVRILSAGMPASRITIRNVHGNFYCYCVGLTHYFPQKPAGRFDDIVIEDVFAAKTTGPGKIDCPYRRSMELIQIQGPVTVGTLVVSRLFRTEKTLDTPTFGLDAASRVEKLTIRDCRMNNRLEKPITFIRNRQNIADLKLENNTFEGEWEGRD